MPYGRHGEGRASQARGRPGTEVQEALESARDPRSVEGPVALHGHERVVAHAHVLPQGLHRDQDEIGAAQGQPANAWSAHALRRQM